VDIEQFLTNDKEFSMSGIFLDKADLLAVYKFATWVPPFEGDKQSELTVDVSVLEGNLILYRGFDPLSIMMIINKVPDDNHLPPSSGMSFDLTVNKVKFQQALHSKQPYVDVSMFHYSPVQDNPLAALNAFKNEDYVRGEVNVNFDIKNRVKAALGNSLEDLLFVPFSRSDAIGNGGAITYWITPVQDWEKNKDIWYTTTAKKYTLNDNKVICVGSYPVDYSAWVSSEEELATGIDIWKKAKLAPERPAKQVDKPSAQTHAGPPRQAVPSSGLANTEAMLARGRGTEPPKETRSGVLRSVPPIKPRTGVTNASGPVVTSNQAAKVSPLADDGDAVEDFDDEPEFDRDDAPF
jgi:hypothetical protein